MKTYHKVVTCLILALLVAAVLVAQKPTKPVQEPDVDHFPILDYAKKSTALDKKNRKRYNNRHAPKIGEASDTIFSMSDWEVGLPALPTDKSAAIIVGEVIEAQAQLSDDETNIYSEFTVQITGVVKNDNNASLAVSNSLIVERAGGRLRLPSGKVVVSRTDKQDLPRIGKRYALFLTKDDGEDFHILTGYELRNGMVFPLDKLRPEHPITAYTGTSETSFFSDLNRILANPSTSQSRY